jgi:hypothetical protein
LCNDCIIVALMKQILTHDPDVQKVIRIAQHLGIDLNEAALTCDAFELAFSDYEVRCQIFEMMDELDAEADAKGEPEGLIISYAVGLGLEGIKVSRYADKVSEGESIPTLPPDTARIYCRISDNFPTLNWLGPLIVNRPKRQDDNADTELSTMAGLSPSDKLRLALCERDFRPTFAERFPIVPIFIFEHQDVDGIVAGGSSNRDTSGQQLIDGAASHIKELSSGLSPPCATENVDTPA